MISKKITVETSMMKVTKTTSLEWGCFYFSCSKIGLLEPLFPFEVNHGSDGHS
jgi:hypothetical protein